MENPVSRPEFSRTCPGCNRPVAPGYKFCETCGTRIPDLLTCSKCGTQFIYPKKFCDLCGAPFIQEEIPEPDTDEMQEPDGAEIQESDADEASEPDEEEIPEPDADEMQEPDGAEIQESDADKALEPDEEEIPEPDVAVMPEPDTDELLEQYGGEYGEDETLESHQKPKPPSPKQRSAKNPVTVTAPQGQGSSETVDDALFFFDKEPVAAKPPVNKIRIIGGSIVLITILAAFFFIGLPMLSGNGGFSPHSNLTAVEITPIPEPTIAGTTPPTLAAPSSRALLPLPTQLIPGDQKFYFQVQKNPITSKISVIFTGSAGVDSISSADVKVTHPDGSVSAGIILPLKGVSDITLDGSKETDRVEIIVKMASGKTYRVYDDLVPFIR